MQYSMSRLSELQPAMVDLVVQTNSVDLRSFERLDSGRIDRDLQPTTMRLLHGSIRLLDQILDVCEGSHGESTEIVDTEVDSFDLDGLLDSGATSGSAYTDVEQMSFIAQLELRQRQQRVQQAPRIVDLSLRLSEHESALRRIRKAFGAIDAVIARIDEVPARLDHVTTLRSSLAVRRAYARFGQAVAAAGEPTTRDLHARMRQLGTAIAVVIGWDIYPELRIQDRLLLRELQDRILGWIRTPDATADDGVRIWTDLASCAEMFRQVRNRQELREHDQHESAALAPVLATVGASELVAPVTWQRLQTLVGIELSCDPALLRRSPVTGAEARDLLVRIRDRIAPAS